MNENELDFLLRIIFISIASTLVIIGLLRWRWGYTSERGTQLKNTHRILLRLTQVSFWLPMSLFLVVLIVGIFFFLTSVTL